MRNDTSNITANTTANSDIHSFVTIISISTSSFSLLGSSFVIFLYIAFHSLQQPHFKMVFNTAISILILSIGNLVVTSSPDSIIDPSYCHLQAYLINFGGLSNIFWSFLSCLYMLRVFSNNDGLYMISDKIAYGFGYGVSFLMSFIPLAVGAYAHKDYICWIQYENHQVELFLVFLEFYLPLWLTFCVYLYTLIKISQRDKSQMNSKQMKKFNMIKIYPIILMLCWVWGSMDVIAQASDTHLNVLKILHVFFGGIQGFFVALVFFSAHETKLIVKNQLCSMLPCFYERKSAYKHHLQEEVNESKEENTENQEKKLPEQELVDA